MTTLGTIVKTARARHRLTQIEAASRMKVTVGTMQRLERDCGMSFHAATLGKVAEFTGHPIEYVISLPTAPPAQRAASTGPSSVRDDTDTTPRDRVRRRGSTRRARGSELQQTATGES